MRDRMTTSALPEQRGCRVESDLAMGSVAKWLVRGSAATAESHFLSRFNFPLASAG